MVLKKNDRLKPVKRKTPTLDAKLPKAKTQRPRAVILTALPLEYNAVRRHLADLHEETHMSGTVYEIGTFNGKDTWDVCIVEIGAGNVTASAEAERAIQHFGPRVLLFVGIAGGLKDVVIGDVVVATKIYGYESGNADTKFQNRPDVRNSSYRLEQRARAEAKKAEWRKRLVSNSESNPPRVLVGAIAAGEKVVASEASEVYAFLRSAYSDALAVEMEGGGLLKGASMNPQLDALVVRGISDLIDNKEQADQSGSQEVAADNAACFAFEILAKIELPAKLTTAPFPSADTQSYPELPPTQPSVVTRSVDPSGRGDYVSVSDAVDKAAPGERILVKPGAYTGPVVVTKVLEIVGDGKPGDIVIQANDDSCLIFMATMGRVTNITFRQTGSTTTKPCVDICQGRLEFEGCSASSQVAAAVVVHDGADPRFRWNSIHDSRSAGIVVRTNGLGVFEENEIFSNDGAGVEIASGGSPTIRNNKIHDGNTAGVFAHDLGLGPLRTTRYMATRSVCL
jgi:nucleoside phosphorylase